MFAKPLHLPNLVIKGFRGIEVLSIRNLGRVTLIVGRNSVGKTTVLEAVQAFASRGRILGDIIDSRGEYFYADSGEGSRVRVLDWASLFYGRAADRDQHILIGATDPDSQLRIEMMEPAAEWNIAGNVPHDWRDGNGKGILSISYQGKTMYYPNDSLYARRRFRSGDDPIPALKCTSLGPGLLNSAQLAEFWDEIALTPDEGLVVKALGLIFGEEWDRIAVAGSMKRTPRILVRSRESGHPVPLESLGDGAVRLTGTAMALAKSQNGFLLLDEAENGLHFDLQTDFWRLVLQAAHQNNVQVLATTHSWDCVKGFARAAVDSRCIDGHLVRIDKDDEGVRAVEYSEEDLTVAAEYGIEVR